MRGVDERRVRGRPIEIMFDAQGIQSVRGGFIPRPRGAQLGDFCAAPHSKRSSQGSTRRCFPISFGIEESISEAPFVSQPCDEPDDIMIHSSHLMRDDSGSVDGLSPGTDEADEEVSGVTKPKNAETKTSDSRNPVAGGGSGGDNDPEVTAAVGYGGQEQSTYAHTTYSYAHTYVCIICHTHIQITIS